MKTNHWRELVAEWRSLLTDGIHWRDDLKAALTVACIALPMALAIALASDVPPAVGLITAIVASIACAVFGGTQVGISGPAAAMAILIAEVVEKHGLTGLAIVGLGCGLLQFLSGTFGLGSIARFIPFPVVAGFTAGIGAIIFIGQLPRALGLPSPDESHVLSVIVHLREMLQETHPATLALTLGTLSIAFVLPVYFPKWPAALVAVIIPTLVVVGLDVHADTLGTLTHAWPQLQQLPDRGAWLELLEATLVAYALASFETLMSASAIDKLSKTSRTNFDQELVGQGLSNIVVALVGGMPATSVIARSSLNIHAGAKTRFAAIAHGLILLAVVVLGAPLIARIPVAVVVGILLSIALRMFHPREFLGFWERSRMDALAYGLTFLTIVFVDLVAGVQAGCVAALVIAILRMGQIRTQLKVFPESAILELKGSLNSLAAAQMDRARTELSDDALKQGLIIDLAKVTSIDASGASHLIELIKSLRERQKKVAVRGINNETRSALHAFDLNGDLAQSLALTESEVADILHADERLLFGALRYRREVKPRYQELFNRLAEGQKPHTLFIACSDSRIDPNLITTSDPGELFFVRNVGNIIPRCGADALPAEGAAIEFAVGILEVREIIVCGHSGCGAIKEVLAGNIFSDQKAAEFPHVAKWLADVRSLKDELPANVSIQQAAELNVLNQIEKLKTYPVVQEKLRQGKIRIHPWYFDIAHGELYEWDFVKGLFVPVGTATRPGTAERISAGIQYQIP
jgi:carbonic anhydrase